jgi:hypothetical protein
MYKLIKRGIYWIGFKILMFLSSPVEPPKQPILEDHELETYHQ